MTGARSAAGIYTPGGLTFDEATHTYYLYDREQIPVTTALTIAGLIDTSWDKSEDAQRGTRLAAAIQLLHRGEVTDAHLDAEIRPYFNAYMAFGADGRFRVDANEERLCDPTLHCAGTLDLRGQFRDVMPGVEPTGGDVIDVIDIESGTVPSWVGYQTAGYVRLLPTLVARRCRRWVLQLTADGTFSLNPLTKRSDGEVFLAALTIAVAKRGWL